MNIPRDTVIDPSVSAETLRESAACLLDYLKLHGGTGRPFEILQFLASETLKALDEGRETRFNNYAIRLRLTGESEGDASAWLSRPWKKLMTEIRLQREDGLKKFAADRGLAFYPWVDKRESSGGAGNQALHYLVAIPLEEKRDTAPTLSDLPPPDITYIPAERLTPSRIARLLFDKNLVASGMRKWLFLWPSILWFVILGLLGAAGFYALGQSTTPLSANDLMNTIVIAAIGWYALRTVRKFERLVEDRLVMASDGLLGIREFGVCLELFTTPSERPGGTRSLRMVKYAAECPICKAQVLLDAGEPDFPRRVVGRCQESPREHVFSFDRVSCSGYRLRHGVKSS